MSYLNFVDEGPFKVKSSFYLSQACSPQERNPSILVMAQAEHVFK